MGIFSSKPKNPGGKNGVAGNPPVSSQDKKPDTSSAQSAPAAPPKVDLGPPADEYKVLVLGELNVGKTNLLLRFCDGLFVEEDPTHTKPPPEAHLGSGNDRVCGIHCSELIQPEIEGCKGWR